MRGISFAEWVIRLLVMAANAALVFELYVQDSVALAVMAAFMGVALGGLWLHNYGQGRWWFT